MAQNEGIDEYEFISKDDLDDTVPHNNAEIASSAASTTSIFQDRNTHTLAHLIYDEDECEEEELEVSSQVAGRVGRFHLDRAEVGLFSSDTEHSFRNNQCKAYSPRTVTLS
jgi:hypothetical protein